MIHELRVYEVMPGKLPALNDRFENITCGMFEKHGIHVVGFWTQVVGTSNELVYLLEFDNLGHREKAWGAFQNDPEWLEARASTEREAGPLVSRIRNMILQPTSYSPMQ